MNEKNKDSRFLNVIDRHAEKVKSDASLRSKESKFFDAINQDAREHMERITKEIEEYKNTKIEQATEQGLNDAYELMREDASGRAAAIMNEVSRKELALRNQLYQARQTIRDEVFRQAEEKLRAFTRTEDYTRFLTDSLQRIAQTVGTDHCVVYIASADEDRRDLILSSLPTAEISVDSRILIGGVRVHCPAQGRMLDDTIDTRLADQYAWFNENSGLKVV